MLTLFTGRKSSLYMSEILNRRWMILPFLFLTLFVWLAYMYFGQERMQNKLSASENPFKPLIDFLKKLYKGLA
ncbi:Hypothetical predicted protein [Mytilus galloprovincialis]|uniref:Uncharacterized protein n=2 Tax=Mytilus galloprovincialis TaxID=29158 RepID=A0A8B6GJM8_MYTGA|nr:Hypothetical predicted protein [Mytilus galloprovincialis]